MAVSTLAPQASEFVRETTGTYALWNYTTIGGMFIGTYLGYYTGPMDTSANGADRSDKITIPVPANLVTQSICVSGAAGQGMWVTRSALNASSVEIYLYRMTAIASVTNEAYRIMVIGKAA